MDQKSLIGVVVGLMIATSMVYFIETIEEFEEQDIVKAPFFLIVAIAYLPVSYRMISKKSSIPYAVAIAGSIGIMVLYAATRTNLATIFGIEAGGIGHMGIISKVLQVGVGVGSILALLQTKKDK